MNITPVQNNSQSFGMAFKLKGDGAKKLATFLEEVAPSTSNHVMEDLIKPIHPLKTNVIYDGQVIGYLGEIHPTVAANYSIKDRVYVAVIDMPEIVSRATFDRKYEGIAKYPAVSRDLSMVVPKHVLAGDIEKVFDERGGKILESYELFDIYEGAQIKAGFKSLAYKLTFRAKDRTLEEADITAAMKKIMNGLERLGIELRQQKVGVCIE